MKILSDCSTCFDHASRRSCTSYCGNNNNNNKKKLVNKATLNNGEFSEPPTSRTHDFPDTLNTGLRTLSPLFTLYPSHQSIYHLKLPLTQALFYILLAFYCRESKVLPVQEQLHCIVSNLLLRT